MENNWMEMAQNIQSLMSFSRTILYQEADYSLTRNEMEILTEVYLRPKNRTPISISNFTGIKKESLSRSLKNLDARGLIDKKKNPEDERSYVVLLNSKGREELEKNYKILLMPYYQLAEKMEDFHRLIELSKRANDILESYYKGED